MNVDSSPDPLPCRRRNPIIRLFSSVWFGITLLVLILVYSSIMSALPPVRAAVELTEMGAYRHPLFVTLVGLFVLSLLTATLMRTRWLAINAGALTTHIGLLILIGGALVYFGTKVEGDIILEMPAIQVRLQQGNQSRVVDRLPIEPGRVWAPPTMGASQWPSFEILPPDPAETDPESTARVAVRSASGEPRTIRLVADRWEDVGQGLSLGLSTYPPRDRFFEDEKPALHLRDQATGAELIRPIPHLPIYGERYLPDEGELRNERGEPVPSNRTRPELRLGPLTIPTGWFEPWRLPIDVAADGLPFQIRVTGYVPHAISLRPEPTAAEGISRWRPVLALPENERMASPALRLTISGKGPQGDWSQSHWCLFSGYPDLDAQPIRIQPPGSGTVWELIYSRMPRPLGASLTGQRLVLTYFPGRRGIESFRSEFLMKQGSKPAVATSVQTNRTLTVGRWTLFQSGYDSEDHWRYTILGVGNRRGILAMNVGWIVVTLGCIYAFYVKPVLLRRAREGTR